MATMLTHFGIHGQKTAPNYTTKEASAAKWRSFNSDSSNKRHVGSIFYDAGMLKQTDFTVNFDNIEFDDSYLGKEASQFEYYYGSEFISRFNTLIKTANNWTDLFLKFDKTANANFILREVATSKKITRTGVEFKDGKYLVTVTHNCQRR